MGAKIEKNYIIFSVKKNDNNNADSNDSNKESLYFRTSCI